MDERVQRMAAIRNRGLYGGKGEYSDEYYTPATLTYALGRFDLDPCAGPSSHAKKNVRLPLDGLAIPWNGRVWLNPPYSDIHPWLEKFMTHGNGICLVHARPETRWFQRLAQGADAVLWIFGRVHFETPSGVKRYPTVGSTLVAYGKANALILAKSKIRGIRMRPER